MQSWLSQIAVTDLSPLNPTCFCQSGVILALSIPSALFWPNQLAQAHWGVTLICVLKSAHLLSSVVRVNVKWEHRMGRSKHFNRGGSLGVAEWDYTVWAAFRTFCKICWMILASCLSSLDLCLARMDTISVYFLWCVMCLEQGNRCNAVCYDSYPWESTEDWFRLCTGLKNPWMFNFLIQKWHSIWI